MGFIQHADLFLLFVFFSKGFAQFYTYVKVSNYVYHCKCSVCMHLVLFKYISWCISCYQIELSWAYSWYFNLVRFWIKCLHQLFWSESNAVCYSLFFSELLDQLAIFYFLDQVSVAKKCKDKQGYKYNMLEITVYLSN